VTCRKTQEKANCHVDWVWGVKIRFAIECSTGYYVENTHYWLNKNACLFSSVFGRKPLSSQKFDFHGNQIQGLLLADVFCFYSTLCWGLFFPSFHDFFDGSTIGHFPGQGVRPYLILSFTRECVPAPFFLA
jgi:hypothetical protein